MHTHQEHLIHGSPVELDNPMDVEENQSSSTSGGSVASFEDSEDRESMFLHSVNMSAERTGMTSTCGHCKQGAPVFNAQHVIIQQLVISQLSPQAVIEMLKNFTTLESIHQISDATPATMTWKAAQAAPISELLTNPWNPYASADEDFSRRAEQAWRREFTNINPKLMEMREDEPKPSDPQSTETPGPQNATDCDDKPNKPLPLCVKLLLWTFVLAMGLLYFWPWIVSAAAAYYSKPQEKVYHRWTDAMMLGIDTIYTNLLFLRSLFIFPFRVMHYQDLSVKVWLRRGIAAFKAEI